MLKPTHTKQQEMHQKLKQQSLARIKSIKCLYRLTEKMHEGVYQYWAYNEITGWNPISKGTIDEMKNNPDCLPIVVGALTVDEEYIPFADFLIDPKANTFHNPTMNSWTNPALSHLEALGGPVDTKVMPKVYEEFFKGLIKESVDYEKVLDWMALSLREKVQKYLYVVSNGGVGKEVWYTIMSKLHHSDNSKKVDNKALSSDFNSYLVGNTLLYLDEPSTRNDEVIKNKLKTFINKTLSVNEKFKKGTDKEVYFSFFITGNLENGISLDVEDHDNRRFYCPETTGVRMTERYTSVDAKVKELHDPKNIAEFYFYLMEREVKTDFTKDHITDHHKRLITASATDYMHETVEGYIRPMLKNRDSLYFEDIKEWMLLKIDSLKGKAIGVHKFKKELERSFGNEFKFVENNKEKEKKHRFKVILKNPTKWIKGVNV
jgi:hypothetical protein